MKLARFNTSHVTLYLNITIKYITYFLVSIHLMLLFIVFKTAHGYDKSLFQYISCYSLSTCRGEIHTHEHVSIHLMLLFIEGDRIAYTYSVMFQYISCYSLSHVKWRKKKENYCFNTSHVTLYRQQDYSDFTEA